MNRSLFPLLLSVLLLAGAGCAARAVSPVIPTTASTDTPSTVAPASTDWLGFHSDALKFSVSYAPSLALDTMDDRSVAFSEVESGYGTYAILVSATTFTDTAAWVAAQKTDKLTPFFLIKSDGPDQILEVVTHPAETDSDHGRPIYSTQLEAVEVQNGMAYIITWRNQTPAGSLLTLMDADTLRFLRSFVVDVPPLSFKDQAWHDANASLTQFLGLLHERAYAAAGGRYGGDLSQLRAWNPEVGQNDVVALWKNGCEINGLQCLRVASVVPMSHDGDDTFNFSVTFTTNEGTLFAVHGQSDFPFVVRAGSDGLYLVETIPPYQE